MGSYLYGYISTDSRNELAQARFSQLQERAVALDKLQTRFTAWVGTLPIEELAERSTLAAEHEFPLRQLHVAARHLMSEEAEALAAELSPSRARRGPSSTTISRRRLPPRSSSTAESRLSQ